jgi:hypothetical protein
MSARASLSNGTVWVLVISIVIIAKEALLSAAQNGATATSL